MLRVVIDTNVIISALNFGGNPKAILALARRRHIRNTTSPFIINEIERVLTRKFGWQIDVTRLWEKICASARILLGRASWAVMGGVAASLSERPRICR
jgi:putative PIN family toxin of toxin-antitoxin system